MASSSSTESSKKYKAFALCRRRRTVWIVSGMGFVLSLLGFLLCYLNPSIKAPLRPGLDFTGGTQIQLERNCQDVCQSFSTSIINEKLSGFSLDEQRGKTKPNFSQIKVQLLDDSRTLVLRLPFLSATQSLAVVEEIEPFVGPFVKEGQSIDTIGPTLGIQLLRSSLVSLLVAFAGIAVYISIRYDRVFALLALIALAHDVTIVCGIFSWLGLFFSVEVDSLFAVALLTIAGYSVNDTVVVFDRIRERLRDGSSLSFSEQIDRAVSATFTRTIYTSGTTLLPLLALIFFGGSALYWFAIALALGVLIGSWSSIALAPTLLSLKEHNLRAL